MDASTSRPLNRRRFLMRSIGLMAAATSGTALLSACGPTVAPAAQATAAPAAGAATAPAAAAATTSPAVAAGPSVTLLVNGISPADNPASVDFKRALDDMTAASNGRLKFDWRPGGVLVPTPQALAAVGQGTIDMLIATASTYGNTVSIGGWADIPVYPKGYEATLKTFYETEIHKLVDEVYRTKTNTTVVQARALNPYVFIMGKGKDIKTVGDFKGKKIRTAGGTQAQVIQALGATNVSLTPGDFYTSFQQGIVDGFLLPLYAMDTYKLQELAGSVTQPGIGSSAVQQVWMNLDKWNQLPLDLQQLITQFSRGADIPKQAAYWTELEKKALDTAQKSNVQLIRMTEAELAKMKELTATPIAQAYATQNGEAGKKIVDILNTASRA